MLSAKVSQELFAARAEYVAAEGRLAVASARLNAAERAAHQEFEALMRGACDRAFAGPFGGGMSSASVLPILERALR